MSEKEHRDRARRLSAVMRFVAQMREAASERELIESLVQATAVWYDLDARAYRSRLDGRCEMAVHLPGADLAEDPGTLDIRELLSPDAASRLGSLSELEQLGWRGQQTEVLLLPIAAADTIRWVLALPGSVDREVEELLLPVCRIAGGVIEQQEARQASEAVSRLRDRMSGGRQSFQARTRGLVEEVEKALGAAGVRMSVRAGERRALTLAAAGGTWDGAAAPAIGPGDSWLDPGRLVFGLPLGNDGVGVLEVLAREGHPFGLDQVALASAAASAIGAWLSGVSSSAGRAREAEGERTLPFEREIQAELQRARRLSLKGGVLVATVPGSVPDPIVLSAVIQVVRSELRSCDLLGQLSGGDIAAVLLRTSSEGVAKAAVRVRQRLDAMARDRKLPAVVVGHAMYPGTGPDSPAALVSRARHEAGLMFSN